jgi:hydrogenase-4 component F
MLSGVLLNAALFAVIRYKILVDTSLHGSAWTDMLMLTFGVITCAVAAAFIIAQTDYKRLLAYSSIENMAVIVFTAGLGAWGAVALVIHTIAHALAKSMLFFTSGDILIRFKSTKFDRVFGVMSILPYTGTLFLVGMLALLAVPPSPLFFSEYIMVSAGITTHPILISLMIVSLAIAFAGFIRLFMPFLLGKAAHGEGDGVAVHAGEVWSLSHTAALLHIALLSVIGILLWDGALFGMIVHIASFTR